MRRLPTIAITLLLIIAAEARGEGGWRVAAWPFPADAWPEGRAYHCDVAQCGAELDLYIRPKIGFCDCYRGVADDDEIDRVGDLALLSRDYAPLQRGAFVRLAGMVGRAR